MATFKPTTFADDFNERMIKNLRPKFKDNVDNPRHLIDYLTCLEPIDEEIVKAQQNQFGAICAASVLFERLIRRYNWFEDLIKALRNSDVGLGFLADEFEKFILTVPARWDIAQFNDEFGRACFNGNCPDIEPIPNINETSVLPTGGEIHKYKHLPTEREHIVPLGSCPEPSSETNQSKEHKDETSNTKRKTNIAAHDSQEDSESGDTCHSSADIDETSNTKRKTIIVAHDSESGDTCHVSADIDETINTKRKTLAESREEINLQRERLRLNMMEKIYKMIKGPEDVPIALQYMEKANIVIGSIERGSLIVNIYIDSLEALHTFEQLSRYGGLKRLLDKELLDMEMIKSLKAVSETSGHHVDDIQSRLDIYETDLERCRSWLVGTNIDARPGNFTDSLLHHPDISRTETKTKIKEAKATRAYIYGKAVQKPRLFMRLGKRRIERKTSRKETREMARYVTERLPEELQCMIEDPFVADRIEQFYQIEELREKYDVEQGGVYTSKSVATLFVKWFDEEMSAHIQELDDITQKTLLNVAVYLVQRSIAGNSIAIPENVLYGDSDFEYVVIAGESRVTGCMFDLIKVPVSFTVNKQHVRNGCEYLKTHNFIRRSKGEFNFNSALLRDVFVIKVAFSSDDKGDVETQIRPFEYAQTLIGVFSQQLLRNLSPENERHVLRCAFKTPILREVGISDTAHITFTNTSDSCFFNADILCGRHTTFQFPNDIVNYEGLFLTGISLNKKTNWLVIDVSNIMQHISFSVAGALHWLNITGGNLPKQLGVIQTEDCEEYSELLVESSPGAGYSSGGFRKNIPTKVDRVFPKFYYASAHDEGYLNIFRKKFPSKVQLGFHKFLDAPAPDVGYSSVLRKRYTMSVKINDHDLTDCDIEQVGQFLNVSPDVLKLNVRKCNLSFDKLRHVLHEGYFRNVVYLNISDNKYVNTNEPPGIMYMRALQSLEIQNCELGDRGISLLAVDLAHTGKLKELNVANNQMSYVGLLELSKALTAHTCINGLRVHKNCLGKEGSLVLASWLRHLIILEVLNISECGIGDKGGLIIAGSLVSQSLRKLSMRENGLTAQGSQDFFQTFHRPPSLEHLDFSGNAIFTPSHVIGIAMAEDLAPSAEVESFVDFLQQPTPMSHLSLWNCCIGEKRIFQNVLNYKGLQEMTYLCLQENKITDDFGKDIAEFIRIGTYLQHLNLRQNQIGTMAAKDIAESLSKQIHLKEVLLDRNEIGDDGAERIVKVCASLPNIECIDLSYNNISRNMMSSIIKDLEDSIKRPKYQIKSGVGLSSVSTVETVQETMDDNVFLIKKEGTEWLIKM